MTFAELAARYHHDVHAAERAKLSAEPEAQLTTPVSNLFSEIVARCGLGTITLVREQRTGKTRPDFGVLHRKGQRELQRGYIELKAPSVSIDTSTWKEKDRNFQQWKKMAVEAEVLLVCNGKSARLYVNGEADGLDAELPWAAADGWNHEPLEKLLRRFLDAKISPVKSIGELATRLAHRTADLRDRLLWLLEQQSDAGELARAQYAAWCRAIHAESTHRDFADGLAQVVSYGMVLAAFAGVDADANEDGILSIAEAREATRSISPVMAAAFSPLLEEPLFSAVRVETGHLEALVSAIDVEKVTKSADARGEPWLYFYEDFLGVYDPAERKQAGVYYTPTAIVRAMVAMVDHVLVERFGLRAGFADPSVVTLDPAVGTGTFPLAVIDRAVERMTELRGPAGKAQVAANLSKNLVGFELLPGPYSVAHLRLTQRLRQLDPTAKPTARIILTDTLESPEGAQSGQLPLFGEARVLGMEQNRARQFKSEEKVTVVLGNPPYRRVRRTVEGRGSGGWVVSGSTPAPAGAGSGESGRPTAIFEDVLSIARDAGLGVHLKNVYNLYAYFWRWAQWKVFEHHGEQPGIVAFITASSWLTGDAFVGLREIARRRCDEIFVIDLGGESLGAAADENVFAINTPVSVVVLVRTGEKAATKAGKVWYRRIQGSAEAKLAAMDLVARSSNPFKGEWGLAADTVIGSFVPASSGGFWSAFAELRDLFPWQHSGVQYKRTWPIDGDRSVLESRLSTLRAASEDELPVLFRDTSARTGSRFVRALEVLKGYPIARFGGRSFDRQWCVRSESAADRFRPALWASESAKQVFLAAPLSEAIGVGPTVACSAFVPDLHFFRGSFGGKDVLPLFRDAAGVQPNVTAGLLAAIGKAHGTKPPSPEDLAAYVYALLSAPAYQARFAEPLQTPGPRVPMTADAALWREAVELGTWLLWLHTYAERMQGPGRGKHVPTVKGLGWIEPVRKMPESPKQLSYDPKRCELHVGDGVVGGVRPEVWGFSVSGMPVVKKWLAYRTAKGAGRAASSENPLDRIRPTAWLDEWNDELLDLLRVLTLSHDRHPAQAELLERICAGPLLPADELPKPTEAERKPPEVD